MVLTRHSLSSLNLTESAPSSVKSEIDVAAAPHVSISRFDIGRSDEENDTFRKRIRASSSRPLYRISSDAENEPPESARPISVSSRRSEPGMSIGRPRRNKLPRGYSLFSVEQNHHCNQRHSETPTVVEEDEPDNKRSKTEEPMENISFRMQQEAEDAELGRTRQQTRRLNCIFSGVATETCDDEDLNVNSTETEMGDGRELREKPTYNLRAERKAPQFFCPSSSKKPKSSNVHVPQFFASTLSSRIRENSKARKHSKKKRKAKFHESDSDSSSSSSSGDERRFIRRKKKSMTRSRMSFLPMNLSISDMTRSQRDRKAIGASLADVDPMNIDKSASFGSIGGLNKHIRSLKEMVLLPFLYPELFSKFNINPPRGCLFYGPPGTGKTLMARALANECSKETGRKISFFMRKGADCLSKWVGESERQLRLLFDQAYIMRPSIIFFDEIDGLAPVRSSRQDQIHSSIVSTLLALMDGLDNRGEIIVIGATNRIDSIDPALRRPGRFDREFLFKLPDAQARVEIVKIATKSWNPPMSPELSKLVAEKTHGYSGADLNLLCMESALIATRRNYPQIYLANNKLEIDISSVNVEVVDVFNAMRSIKVSTTRITDCPAQPLSPSLALLLGSELQRVVQLIKSEFYHESKKSLTSSPLDELEVVLDGLILPENAAEAKFETLANLVEPCSKAIVSIWYNEEDNFVDNLLLPAILNEYEDMQSFMLNHSTLFGHANASAEETVVSMLKEAAKSQSAVICIPNAFSFYSEASSTVRLIITEFILRLRAIPGNFLVLATLPNGFYDGYGLPKLFEIDVTKSSQVICQNPTRDCYRRYFAEIFHDLIKNCTFKKKQHLNVKQFKKAKHQPKEGPAPLNESEIKRIREKHLALMRELRIYLRDVLNRLARSPEHRCFLKPVDREEVNDYYDVIKHPMDLTTMMSKTDSGQYVSIHQFIEDIDLIADNALEYNPVKDPMSLRIRHRACAFRDSAMSMVKIEIDSDFEEQCRESLKSFSALGLKPQTKAPKFFFTQPLQKPPKEKLAMKLRSTQGDLVEPLTPAKSVKSGGVVKKKNQTPSRSSSQGIINKYRKQRQQAYVNSVKSGSSGNSGQNNRVSPLKSRVSPVMSRVTRSKSSIVSGDTEARSLSLAETNSPSVAGSATKFQETEKVENDRQLSEDACSSHEGNAVYNDKMLSPDNEKEQTKLLLESNAEVAEIGPSPKDEQKDVNEVEMNCSYSSSVSLTGEIMRSEERENESLFKEIMMSSVAGGSSKSENEETKMTTLHPGNTENSVKESNAEISTLSAMSPEVGNKSVETPDLELKRKEEIASKLDKLNNTLLDVAVVRASECARILDVVEMHNRLRQIIYKYKTDKSDEKEELYKELKNYLNCNYLEL